MTKAVDLKRTLPDLAADRLVAQRYMARWKQLGSTVVLERSIHPEQWRAWLAWSRANGLKTQAELLSEKQTVAVPTLWPHEFEHVEVAADKRVKDD